MDRIPALVNASFHGATYSSRIWKSHLPQFHSDLQRALSRGLILGEDPLRFRRALVQECNLKTRKAFKAASTLLRTEMARVQTSAELMALKEAGFEEYEYIANVNCCPHCQELDGKIYPAGKATPGTDVPPMHPNCRCSIAPYSDRKDYEKWLDTYSEHGLSYEEWKAGNEAGSKGGSLNSTEMYRLKGETHRKTGRQGQEIIDKATFNRITKPAIKKGANTLIADSEWEIHLEKQEATAVTIGDSIIFRYDATVTDVLEEVHHFYQNKNHMNDDKPDALRTILNEIDAKLYLIDQRKRYKIPEDEDTQTRKQLDSYLQEFWRGVSDGNWKADDFNIN